MLKSVLISKLQNFALPFHFDGFLHGEKLNFCFEIVFRKVYIILQGTVLPFDNVASATR